MTTTPVRLQIDFNQGWRFFRPAPAPVVEKKRFIPPTSALVKQGVFEASIQPQDVRFDVRTARQVCLESLSDYNGGKFAAMAEFYLLDETGKPLPRADWKIAYVDSEDIGAGDFATNAIDGDPTTKWHSQWQGLSQPDHPHDLVIDLGKPTRFSGFRYLARHDGNHSGMIKGWRFFASEKPFHIPAAEAQAKSGQPPSNDKGWEQVTLPHSVRLEPLNASGGQNYQGVCWYRKQFSLQPDWHGKKIYLNFEGAMSVADVWLNGVKLMTHYGGYLPFTADISANARFGGAENVLSVRLDNSDNPEVPPGKPQNTLDFTYFGGLYRTVMLQVMDPLHITDPILSNKPAGGGIFVTYPSVSADTATVRVQTEVANEGKVERVCTVTQCLLDADDTVAATGAATEHLAAGDSHTFVQALEVPHPRLWHPYHPNLYRLRTVVSENGHDLDDTITLIGIRRFLLDPEKGMFINGERLFSIGANRHQDHPYVGYALPASAHYRDVKKLREGGFTSYRSHYPQDPSFMDACDELGMLAIVSNPGWQFMGNSLFKQRVYQDARDMIRRDRNHPSVLLWEAQLNETDNSSVCEMLQKVVHEEYPGDQCWTSGDRVANAPPDFTGWDLQYGGNDRTRPDWIREWGDQVDNWGDQQSSSRVARGWGETPMLVQAWAHMGRLEGLYSSSVPEGGRLCGACLWAGVDCYRGYHHQPFYGGLLDLFRIPKFDYYMFQSQRPPDLHVPGLDDGPMVYIANFATYYSPSMVTVFSNCEEVRLLKDGKEVATQKADLGHRLLHGPFTFKVGQIQSEQSPLYMTGVAQPGWRAAELKAEGLIGGKVVATHTVRSPGVASEIQLEADLCGKPLVADGSDWVRVYAKVCDSRGTVQPFADDRVTFTVEGEGSIIGDTSIGANPMRAEAGIATALIRSTTNAGKITVHANGFGLKEGTVEIDTVPFEGLKR